MPHISIKMLNGRTEEQKENLSKALVKTISNELKCNENYVTVTIEDYTAKEWQKVFKEEITDKSDKVYISAKYDPKSLL
jgi:4-oxalocrotonate tautomerase